MHYPGIDMHARNAKVASRNQRLQSSYYYGYRDSGPNHLYLLGTPPIGRVFRSTYTDIGTVQSGAWMSVILPCSAPLGGQWVFMLLIDQRKVEPVVEPFELKAIDCRRQPNAC